ncbi:MAG: diguanylate cyclase domain-containing protein [Ignavibacteria bacterium]
MRDPFDRFIVWWPKQRFWRYLWAPVGLSVVMSEGVVALMNLALLGRVDGGYLLTGLVASGFVSLVVSALLFYLAHRVDRRLQEEYAFRQRVIDSIPGAFYLLDMDGRFLMWNHNLEAVVDMDSDELAQAHPLDFFDDLDRPRVELAIREVFETGRSAIEATLCAKDGRRTPYYFNGYRIDLGGRPALLGMGLDITERTHAEAELIEAKDRLALALEASALSIWDFDVNSGIVYLDGRWAEMIGALPGVTIAPARYLLSQTHPDDRDRILRAVLGLFKGTESAFQEEFRFKTVAGDWKWIRCSGKVAERDAGGRAVRAIGTNLDATERKAAEDRIHQLAYYDSLTGLPNRSLLMDRLSQALSQAKRFSRALAVMFLDLDDFKRINDTLGHFAGDELLKQVALRLVGCVRTGDTISRQGGDEFVIVLAEIGQAADAARVAEKVLRAMDAPFRISGHDLMITVSIGISVYPVNGVDDVQELMKKADIAMYAAKRSGHNRYAFHEAEVLAGS